MLYTRRETTGDFRFSASQMLSHMECDMDLKDFGPLLVELGARRLGKARVFLATGEEVQKDNVYAVRDLTQFLEDLSSFLQWLGTQHLVGCAVRHWRGVGVQGAE